MGCIDLTADKSFTLSLGDVNNKIVHTKDQDTEMTTSKGFQILDSNNVPIFKFNVNDQNVMYKELNCQQKSITNLRDPIYSTDAVTKRYFTQYFRQHRENRKIEGTIPNEPFTNIVLFRYNPRRLPSMISMYVERESGTWIDVSCGYFAENWRNFNLFIKTDCFICYFTNITGGPWTRRYILNYMVFLR